MNELMKALKPFAELADAFDLHEDTVVYQVAGTAITAGDVRRAREVYAKHKGSGKPKTSCMVLVNCSLPNCDKMIHVTLTGDGRIVIDDDGERRDDRLVCWSCKKLPLPGEADCEECGDHGCQRPICDPQLPNDVIKPITEGGPPLTDEELQAAMSAKPKPQDVCPAPGCVDGRVEVNTISAPGDPPEPPDEKLCDECEGTGEVKDEICSAGPGVLPCPKGCKPEGEDDPVARLRAATEYVNREHPLPRCEHGNAFRDHGGDRLEPSCGCREPKPKESCDCGGSGRLYHRLLGGEKGWKPCTNPNCPSKKGEP